MDELTGEKSRSYFKKFVKVNRSVFSFQPVIEYFTHTSFLGVEPW